MPARLAWDMLSSLLIAFTVVDVPYRIGFKQACGSALRGCLLLLHFEMCECGLVQEPTGAAAAFSLAVDCLFLLDVVLSFFLGFHDVDGSYVDDPAVIRKRYLRSTFFMDLISSLPLDVIASAAFTSSSGNLLTLKLLRILRLIRLLKLFRLVRLSRFVSRVRAAVQRLQCNSPRCCAHLNVCCSLMTT
jgi:hypothetical protein